MMDLSIIVPMYNAEKYISQCLNSLINQNISTRQYEIIVIDDGSTDDSYRIVQNFSTSGSNIILLKQNNQGVSVARNEGINISKGKYIYFVDADDYIVHNSLMQLLSICKSHDLDVLEFNMLRTSSRELENIGSNSISFDENNIYSGADYVTKTYFTDSNCVYFYKRNFVLSSGIKFIEGRTKQDLMFNAEILPLASRVTFIPYLVYIYVKNPDSIWTSTEPKAAKRSIDDFVFMTLRYKNLIEDYQNKNIGLEIFNRKVQAMLFNIFKRILKSGLGKKKILNYISTLEDNDLYPLRKYTGKSMHGIFLSILFNKKHLFVFSTYIYTILKVPIEKTYISYYSKKKENLSKSIALKK